MEWDYSGRIGRDRKAKAIGEESIKGKIKRY